MNIDRIVDFFFEAGILRFTPRSGWAFLGSGQENVAEHSFRVALISFTLARIMGANPQKAACIGLFHDLHEARTGDLNYLQQRYVKSDQVRAQRDAVSGTPIEEDILNLFQEFEERTSLEAKIVRDADQLDLILNLKLELEKGTEAAQGWIDTALLRLRTKEAQAIAKKIVQTQSAHWWHSGVARAWWIDREESLPSSITPKSRTHPLLRKRRASCRSLPHNVRKILAK